VGFFFSSRRRHTRCYRDWSSDVCSSDLNAPRQVQGGQSLPRGVSLSLLEEAYGPPDPEGDGGERPQELRFVFLLQLIVVGIGGRSEERRVGKGGVDGWWAEG